MQIAKTKGWVKLLAMVVVAVTMLWGMPQSAKAATNPPTVEEEIVRPKVVFRLDDIEDYWREEGQLAPIKTFAEYPGGPESLTIGIIGKTFAQEWNDHADEVKQYVDMLGEKGEVACHSTKHEDFTGMTLEEQEQDLQLCRDKIETVFPSKNTKTFIPPFNNFNEDTKEAMLQEGYSIMSSQCSPEWCMDPGGFTGESPVNLPVGASTGGWTGPYQMQSAEEIFTEIQDQLSSNNNQNWSVVMMHPEEYEDGGVNATNTLREVIKMCKQNGIKLVTFSELVESVPGT